MINGQDMRIGTFAGRPSSHQWMWKCSIFRWFAFVLRQWSSLNFQIVYANCLWWWFGRGSLKLQTFIKRERFHFQRIPRRNSCENCKENFQKVFVSKRLKRLAILRKDINVVLRNFVTSSCSWIMQEHGRRTMMSEKLYQRAKVNFRRFRIKETIRISCPCIKLKGFPSFLFKKTKLQVQTISFKVLVDESKTLISYPPFGNSVDCYWLCFWRRLSFCVVLRLRYLQIFRVKERLSDWTSFQFSKLQSETNLSSEIYFIGKHSQGRLWKTMKKLKICQLQKVS